MWRIRPSIMAIVLGMLVLLLPLGTALPAVAAQNCATPTLYNGIYYMNATVDLPESQAYSCLVQVSVLMQAGKSYLILAEEDALKLNTSKNMLQVLNVSCGSAASVVTTQNNLGSRLIEVGRYLFTAPTTGTYTCKLQGRGATTNNPLDPNVKLRVYGGTGSKTYLSISTSPKTGMQWKQGSQVSVPKGGSGWVLPSPKYPIGTQSSVKLYAGVQMTNCYEGCGGGNYDAFPSTQLAALLVNSAGTECTSVARQYFTVVATTIKHDSHHQKFHNGFFSVTIPTSRPVVNGLPCNYFIFKTLVKVTTAGNGVLVEAADYSNGIAYDA
jgi:hypothetical protein